MPLVHFFNGRIHCLSGTKPDRHTPALDHWSLGVLNGQPIEKTWRSEAITPYARTHTASRLIDANLYILSGQTGDTPAISGSADFLCDFGTSFEDITDKCYRFNFNSGETVELENAPISLSHAEHGVFQIGPKIFLTGGTTLDRNTLSDAILSYDTSTGKWAKVGRLPHPMKSKTAAYWDGWLYIIAGQRAMSATNLRPGKVVSSVWKTQFSDTTST
jgi:N-acetylneuraminic acid mutarotase